MITEYHATAWTTDTQRVRIYPDDDPTYYRDQQDNLGILATHPSGRFGGDTSPQAKQAADLIANYTWDETVEELTTELGATVIIPLTENDGRFTETDPGAEQCDAVIFDTATTRQWTGTPPDRIREALLAELAEYNLWASGTGLFVAALEVRRTWVRADDPSVTKDEWEITDTIHGILAPEWEAVEVAKEYFPQPPQE